jgi:diguanylate cyclase (GGDEF)-like protein
VLIIDDDASFRAMLADLLNSRGLEVIEARSARDATAIINMGNPLMAIVDYRLPEIDGMKWVTSIREVGRNFPIVFLSGVWFDERTFNWLRNILKVSLILRKPVVEDLFLQQIESLLPAQMMLKQSASLSVRVREREAPSEESLEQVDEKIESVQDDAETLEQLRQARSKLEREEKIAAARANYASELAQSWQELSKAVSLTQSEPENNDARNEAVHIAHKICGTAGSIGFVKVGELAGKIEELLRGLDPTDTLREVIWTEIFRALADGETAVRKILERTKGPAVAGDGQAASKILFLGSEGLYGPKLQSLKTDWPIDVELTESSAGGLQKARRMAFDAAIFDVNSIGRDKLFELSKEIREVPGHEALPLSFILGGADGLSPVDLAYAGCSLSLDKPPSKEDLEVTIDKLLSCRQLQKPRILSVDDDEVLTKFISTILSAEGMLVRQLSKPILIMEVMEQFKPDLVLLDVIMPGLSGYDVCRMLRADQTWKTVPIVFLTSKSDKEGRAAAYQAGGNDFLSKPVLAEELITRVKTQLHTAIVTKRKPSKDPNTGALSSDDFMKGAANMLECAKENQQPMTFCLLSLDDFVRITFAHKWSSAQAALATLGKLMHARFKAEDLRGRLGEDGFTLASIGESMEIMVEAVERLLEEFADMKLPSETMGTFKTTFTAGLAEFPTDGSTIEGLLNVANQRMLSGKLEARGVHAPSI